MPPEQYRDNLRAIVDRIRAGTSARIALLSLPPLGERLDAGPNLRLAAYNAAIREIAERTGADYLPLNERMVDLLHRRGGSPRAYDFGFALAYGAAAQHHLLGRTWDEVARSNGLHLFVDHLHLSDRGGAVVTDLAAAWLAGPGSGPTAAGPAVGGP